MATYKVYEDKLIVLRDPMPEQPGNAIILTDDIHKPPCTGVIIAAGDEVKNYSKDDRVAFSEYAGVFLKTTSDLEDTDLMVMREDELLCKLVEESEESEDPDASA